MENLHQIFKIMQFPQSLPVPNSNFSTTFAVQRCISKGLMRFPYSRATKPGCNKTQKSTNPTFLERLQEGGIASQRSALAIFLHPILWLPGFIEAQTPTPNPEIPQDTMFTRTFPKSSRELLPAFLRHESGIQQKLFQKTCSDELSYFRWIFRIHVIRGPRVGVWICRGWIWGFWGAQIFIPEVPNSICKRVSGPLDEKSGCPKNVKSNHDGSNPPRSAL